MLMYAHYDEMDWPYVHRQASQIGVLKILQEIQKKVKRRDQKTLLIEPTKEWGGEKKAESPSSC